MKGKKPNKSEQEWMDRVRALGCQVCRMSDISTPPEYTAIHHVDGKTKPGAHFHVIPLCDKHHQHKDNEKPQRWVSRHGDGRHEFEQAYGTESDMLHAITEELS